VGGSLLLFVVSCDILSEGKNISFSAASNGGRLALLTGGSFLPPNLLKGGLPMMVTYSDLIQIGILIVGICGLFLQVYKKK
jgi:hypothetical protein